MSAATSLSPIPTRPLEPESRVVLYGIDWEGYVRLGRTLERAGSHARLTYLEGTLEIMTTSCDHEVLKKLLARLLEAWALERNVELQGYGQTTFRKRPKKRGFEGDETYTLGRPDKLTRPDIAIEIVISRGVIDKLDVYAGLGVPELWVFEDFVLTVHHLVGSTYKPRPRSELLPALDLAQLASFVRIDVPQTAQVRAYVNALRGANA